MEDPLAILGYKAKPPLPALWAKPPALRYLGSGFQQQDQANAAFVQYSAQRAPQAAPAPTLTSSGLPDIETVQRNMAAGYTEQLKAKQAQEQATIGVIQQISALNPRAPDYLTNRTKLLQAAPWATQSRDVTNLLGVQEEEHRGHLAQVKELGEFSAKFQQDYRALRKEGKKEEEAVELAMGSAQYAKERSAFIRSGAPRDVVDRVFKKDGTIDKEEMDFFEGDQKRMEFEKKMAPPDTRNFTPLSRDEADEVREAVGAITRDPSVDERLEAYNLKRGTKHTKDNYAPKEAYEEGWKMAKKQKEDALRALVNELDDSGRRIPKALEKYLDRDRVDPDLERELEEKLSGAASNAPTATTSDSIPVVNSPAELKALNLPSGAQFRTPDGRVGRTK